MYMFALFIELIVSILLMVAILMQSSKGGGLAGSFGGSNIGAVFGVRRTSDFLSDAVACRSFFGSGSCDQSLVPSAR
jgi:protein translocase SecG subunit